VNGGGVGAFPRTLLTGALGALFAASLYPLWSLEGRWFVVAAVGIGLVSLSMMFAGQLSHRLFILLLFCVPLAGFKKFLFLDDYVTWTNALGIGLIDFMLLGLYLAWACRIFVLRTAPLPRPEPADGWVALLVLAGVLSIQNASEPRLVLFALESLLVHVLVYFYVSRHFRREHLPWYLGAIAFAIVAQTALALVQNRLGMLVGLILDKGAGGEELHYQYQVPGIEDITRGTGTTYDSHAFGIYMAMLLVYPLVFLYAGALPRRLRLASGALLLFGAAGLTVSYSRSAWLCFAAAAALGLLVLIAWRERYVVPSLVGAAIVGVSTAPWLFYRLFERLFNAPDMLLTERFDQFPVAWSIWQENFFVGAGVGNYIDAMYRHNLDWAYEVLVHNVPLYIAAETGLFGLLAYYGLVAAALLRLWRVTRLRWEPASRVALAGFLGLLAYALDGLTDPMFREPVVYLQFWVTVGVSVALARQARELETA
jgi:hypothetical protein